MTNKQNTGDSRTGTLTTLMTLFMGLSILASVINIEFAESWDEYAQFALSILTAMLLLSAAWFGFKAAPWSSLLRKDAKLQTQIGDERALSINCQAQAKAFVGCMLTCAAYILAAPMQTFWTDSKTLHEVSGLSIALLVAGIGSVTFAISWFYLDSK